MVHDNRHTSRKLLQYPANYPSIANNAGKELAATTCHVARLLEPQLRPPSLVPVGADEATGAPLAVRIPLAAELL